MGVPRSLPPCQEACQGAGLGFAVADDGSYNEVGIVEGRSECMG